MTFQIGIIFALIAMLCWGFGDFLIQKSTRKFGNLETLFFISLFGSIVLIPFIYKDINKIFSFQNNIFFILLLASIALLFASLLEFEALKRGKLAVVEPVWSLEILVSFLLAFFLLKESLKISQIFFIVSLVMGLFLVSLKSYHLSKKVWFEKGVFVAIGSAIFMGSANFFVGLGSRHSNALIMTWFYSIFFTLVCFLYLFYNGRINKLFKEFKSSKSFLFNMCILDNAAWIAFALAMTFAPIAIAVALSESYIVIAVFLGMYLNKELIRNHQKLGIILAIISAITLAYITG